MNKDLIAEGVGLILEGIGVSEYDRHFLKTPERVAKLYVEMLTPLHDPKTLWTTFKSEHQNMVILRDHRVVALCPHHLLPVEIYAYVAYLPDSRVLGLSKLARVVDAQLTKPITQEELANTVVDQMMQHLKPKGAGVILVGEHGCMQFRGVRTSGDVVTSAMRGLFVNEPSVKDEFLSACKGIR